MFACFGQTMLFLAVLPAQCWDARYCQDRAVANFTEPFDISQNHNNVQLRSLPKMLRQRAVYF